MITKAEFLEIIEKHLKVRNDGSIFISDEKLRKKYLEYLTQFAAKSEDVGIYKDGGPDDKAGFLDNIYCPHISK